MKTLRRISVWLAIFAGVVSCSPDSPAPGGGKHEVTGISLLARAHGTLLKEKNPTQAKVGETIPFRVVASWAIPYVGDVTEKAKLTVEPAERARIDASGLFTAVAPGKVTLHAEVRVAHESGNDKVLGLEETPQAGQVVATFKDSFKIVISEK